MPTPPRTLARYRRRPSQIVTAVRLLLDTDGLRYRKWGAEQSARRGDWLVDHDGEVYTVDARSFARTYKRVRAGQFIKIAPVWACAAASSGSILTKEGATRYRRGDYLVFNARNGTDGYAMSAARFRKLYVKDRPR